MSPVIFLGILLCGVCVNGVTNYYHEYACENKVLNIKCEEYHVLDIIEANYGRTSELYCRNGPVIDANCYQEDSLSIVSDICEGKRSCSIKAKNDVFGDPCYGNVKYLSVLYRCINVIRFRSALACEDKSVKLKCRKGNVIKIIEANYGRRSKFICPNGPIKTTRCPNSKTEEVVSNMCNHKRECIVQATNNVFGDSCYGTHKYLYVKYDCVEETNNNDNSISVEKSPNLFNCVNGSSISEDLVCNGFHDCPLGDDEIVCDYKSTLACEGQKLEIKCAENEIIEIVNSNYGRLSRNICPRQNLDDRIDCKASLSVNVLRRTCNGKPKCDIIAENENFGDPCYGTHKYLIAYYDCIPNGPNVHRINPRSV